MISNPSAATSALAFLPEKMAGEFAVALVAYSTTERVNDSPPLPTSRPPLLDLCGTTEASEVASAFEKRLARSWPETAVAVNRLHRRLRLSAREVIAVPGAACVLCPTRFVEAWFHEPHRHRPWQEAADLVGLEVEQIQLLAVELTTGHCVQDGFYVRAAAVWLRLKMVASLSYPLAPAFALGLWRALGEIGQPEWPPLDGVHGIRPTALPGDLPCRSASGFSSAAFEKPAARVQ